MIDMLSLPKKTKHINSFMRFFQDIPPLNLEVASLNEYINELSKGIVSQS